MSEKVEVTLESLVGSHELSGVDMTAEDMPSYGDSTYHGSVCRFVLDDKVYTACEDDNDGYRSAMGSLIEGGAVKNMFAPVKVLCSMRTDDGHGNTDETLVMRDLVTGKTVLEVGTDNTDDYYPSFVADFRPQNMASNTQDQS